MAEVYIYVFVWAARRSIVLMESECCRSTRHVIRLALGICPKLGTSLAGIYLLDVAYI